MLAGVAPAAVQCVSDFTGEIAQDVLQPMYEDKTFLPSLHLANLDESDYQP